MAFWNEYGYYRRSVRRAAKGGIKPQGRHFGESWWARRWIDVLESFDIGARLQRGRSYARSGQVLSIAIEKGKVTADVQGSRPRPYSILIEVKAIAGKDWARLVKAISRQALFAAKLLGGEMPQEIERVFRSEGLSLFPAKLSDIKTDCSCPDWSNPCKHIAAVYYLLGEEFDRDPFLIFRLRGMSRDELAAALGESKPSRASAPEGQEPLPADPGSFWGGKPDREPLHVDATVPDAAAAFPKRLGRVPFWTGEQDLLAWIEPVYRRASERALESVTGAGQELAE